MPHPHRPHRIHIRGGGVAPSRAGILPPSPHTCLFTYPFPTQDTNPVTHAITLTITTPAGSTSYQHDVVPRGYPHCLDR